MALTVVTITATGAGQLVVPANAKTATIECWGAGGGGVNGAGGGGAYSRITGFKVYPGDVIPYFVGLSGSGSASISRSTWFGRRNLVLAKGGGLVTAGLASRSVGDVKFSGAAPASSTGGASASPTGDGVGKTSSGPDQGAGGNSYQAGGNPGGGGGQQGNGARGQIRITYDDTGVADTKPGSWHTVVELSSGSSWSVPNDVSFLESIECWGAGGAGDSTGGGGGAYSKVTNIIVPADLAIPYGIGVGGSLSATSSRSTWFGARELLLAKGGSAGYGGTASRSVGEVKFSGSNPASGYGGGSGTPWGNGVTVSAATGPSDEDYGSGGNSYANGAYPGGGGGQNANGASGKIRIIYRKGAAAPVEARSVRFTNTVELTGSGNWTVPSNATALTLVEAWGGGAGGNQNGGGGGAYAALVEKTVTPGQSIAFSVGSGGASSVAGSATWFDTPTTLLADYGRVGVAGSAALSIGDIKFSGGVAASGLGGGAANPLGNGAGNSSVSSAQGANDEDGGSGGRSYGPGGSPGGGGGAQNSGAPGKIRITYVVADPAPPVTDGSLHATAKVTLRKPTISGSAGYIMAAGDYPIVFDKSGITTWTVPDRCVGLFNISGVGRGGQNDFSGEYFNGSGGGAWAQTDSITGIVPGTVLTIKASPGGTLESAGTTQYDTEILNGSTVLFRAKSSYSRLGGKASDCIADRAHSGGDGGIYFNRTTPPQNTNGGGGGGSGSPSGPGSNGGNAGDGENVGVGGNTADGAIGGYGVLQAKNGGSTTWSGAGSAGSYQYDSGSSAGHAGHPGGGRGGGGTGFYGDQSTIGGGKLAFTYRLGPYVETPNEPAEASASVTLAKPIASATARQGRKALGAVTLAKPTVSGSATRSFPQRQASGSVSLPKPLVSATASRAYPLRTASANVTLAKPLVSGKAAQAKTLASPAVLNVGSYSSVYESARQGVGLATGTYGWVGQYFTGSKYEISQVFLSFDLSTLPSQFITKAELRFSAQEAYGLNTIEVRSHDWVDASSFVSGAELDSKPLLGSVSVSAGQTGSRSVNLTGVKRGSALKLVLAGADQRTGTPPVDDDTTLLLGSQAILYLEFGDALPQTITINASATLPKPTASGQATHAVPIRNASGAVSLPKPQASGAATRFYPLRSASGSATLTKPTASGSATRTIPTVSASASVTLSKPSVSGSATRTFPIRTASASVALAKPTALGDARRGNKAQGAVQLSKPVVEGQVTSTPPGNGATANIVLPKPTASGQATVPPQAKGIVSLAKPFAAAGVRHGVKVSGSVVLAKPTVSGQVKRGAKAQGQVALAKPVVSGSTKTTPPTLSISASVVLSKPTVTAQSRLGVTAEANITLLKPTAKGSARATPPGAYASGSVSMPKPVVTGSGRTGTVARSSVELPKPTAQANARHGSRAVASVSLAKPSGNGQVNVGRVINAAIILSKPSVQATVSLGVNASGSVLLSKPFADGSATAPRTIGELTKDAIAVVLSQSNIALVLAQDATAIVPAGNPVATVKGGSPVVNTEVRSNVARVNL